MTAVIWETDDSFDNKFIIWSGIASVLGSTLYADYDYVYLCTWDITRILRGPGSGSGNEERDVTIVSPQLYAGPYIMTHHLDTWGEYFYSVALKAPFIPLVQEQIYHSPWLESTDSWTQYTWSGQPIDVLFPNYLDDLRVLVGVTDSGSNVMVQRVSESGILNSYATNWSAMISNVTVTDLEARVII